MKIDLIKCIGKESNSLESVDEGMVHSEQNVYTAYADPKLSEWTSKIQPALNKPKLKILVEACGKKPCRRQLIELRAGRSKPHRKTRELLASVLRKLGFLWKVVQLSRQPVPPRIEGPKDKIPAMHSAPPALTFSSCFHQLSGAEFGPR
jgi:hypothetical protein